MKAILKTINIFFSIIFLFIAAGVAYVAIPYFGNQALIVRSGSMTPTIGVGSVVVINKLQQLISPKTDAIPTYKKGDIIAFRSSSNPNTIITHRVISSEIKPDGVFYKTKGDANKTPDGWVVDEENILGKSFLVIPYVGNLLAFTKTNMGFPLLIILPSVLVIILEIFNIIKEIRKNIDKKNNSYANNGNRNFAIVKAIIPFLILGLAVPTALAFSSDTEKSANNILSASSVFSGDHTPVSPGHLVISEVQIDGGTAQDNDDDFIEIYNPTSSSINLDGYRLVKRSGGSGNDNNIYTFSSGDEIEGHGFYLWAHQSGGQNPNNYADEIDADVSSADTLGASNSIAIRQGDLDSGTVIDALSWDPGASTLKEGDQYPANPQENQSLERKAFATSTFSTMGIGGVDEFKGNGYDSNNNANDFIINVIPNPQNSSSPTEMP